MAEKKTHYWQWSPDWRLWVLALLLFPVLLGLGFWQLDRATQKSEERERWESVDGPQAWPPETGASTGLPVALSGHYDPERIWLLDNRTRDGQRGYEVLQLFAAEGAHPPVVINRGWVEAPPERARLPLIETPEEFVRVEARVADWPDPLVLGEGDPSDREAWPRRIPALTPELLAAQGVEAHETYLRLSDSDQAGAFRTGWTPDRMEAATHQGYALQWFGLAAVLLSLTVMTSFRRINEDQIRHE